MTTYVHEDIAELEAPAKSDIESRLGILRMLPPEMVSPTISNLSTRANRPRAWLSFSIPSYKENMPSPATIVRQLEAAGWTSHPATLVKWGSYRRSPEPGLQDNIPETSASGYTLTDSEPIAPVWVVPCQHCGPGAAFYMVGPDGNVYRVSVDLPRIACTISAEKKEPRGTWYYVRGTARLHYPEKWLALSHDGEHVAHINAHSQASVDTEQGLSGAIYWEPTVHDQADFPLLASEIIEQLTT